MVSQFMTPLGTQPASKGALNADEQFSKPGQRITGTGGGDATQMMPIVTNQFTPPSKELEGHPAFRHPDQLRLHRAIVEIGATLGDEFHHAARLKSAFSPEPILVTTGGTLLAGFGRWKLAVLQGNHEIPCIEYSLTDDESLQFILSYHRSKRGWNSFVRIRLALTQELALQRRALENMRAGGKYKGWANLPEAQRIDVRQEIATAAGVGCRNVSNVKTLLQVAHPRLIEALSQGSLTINGAMKFCKLPRAEQLEQFIRHSTERATNKVIRRAIGGPILVNASTDLPSVLEALRRQEAREPGSVAIRLSRHKQSVILIGRDLLSRPVSEELKLR